MQNAIDRMAAAIERILPGNVVSLYLFGSVTLEDFRPGWSDIDFVCLTRDVLTEEEAGKLLHLRQSLSEGEPNNPHYRSFEGILTSLEEFRTGRFSRVVYWGTSGQRIRDSYAFDVFSQYSLMTQGRLIRGIDVRHLLVMPSYPELLAGVEKHYKAIRQHAVTTGPDLYACGWLLDIARCLYTLKTGSVISKTGAGQWALDQGLCPDPEQMRRTLQVRRSPGEYKDDPETKAWLASLGPAVQRFADVLQRELENRPADRICDCSQ